MWVTPWETRAIERAQAEPAHHGSADAGPGPDAGRSPAVAVAAVLARGQAVDRARLAALSPGGSGGAPDRARQPRAVTAASRGAGATATRRLLQRYSRSAAAAYARKWAMSDNPAYGRIEPNDCTNFVSQALFAGGWSMVGGSCDDRKDKNVWWFNPMECRWVGGRPWTTEVKASFTWGGAQNLYWFMQESGRGVEVSDPMDLEIGDVLQMDMGAGQYNAGRIGHSMIVTDKTADDLLLSYHEDHHLDEPLVRDQEPLSERPLVPLDAGRQAGGLSTPQRRHPGGVRPVSRSPITRFARLDGAPPLPTPGLEPSPRPDAGDRAPCLSRQPGLSPLTPTLALRREDGRVSPARGG